MTTVDRQASGRQAKLVQRGIDAILERLPVEQESATIWDEAVLRTKEGNQKWMSENLGEWMGSYFGHDSDYILNNRDEPIHAVRGGLTDTGEAYFLDAATLDPFVKRLRAQMRSASVGQEDSSEAIAKLGARDAVLIDGIPSFISVKPIIPSSKSVRQAPGTEFLHIAVQRIDAALLKEIAEQYDVASIRLYSSGALGSQEQAVRIVDRSGKVVGIVIWDVYRPGLQMIYELAPGFGLAIVLSAALLYWLTIRLRRSTSELYASEVQTKYLAFHDTLTSLPNRALFDDRLERALAAARRANSLVALHSVDVDKFKNVNDTLGHPAGDDLIRQVARRLSDLIRETDTVARLGGDEFAVVQSGIGNEGEAEDLAQKIVSKLAEPFDIAGEKVFGSASVGVVVSRASDDSRDELLRKADIALYEAKGRGRNRFEIFVGDMDDLLKRRRLIERELRRAVETQTQLRVVYQPLFGADGESLRGAEALVRWDHPVHGQLSPDFFISIAEERGLIEPLGEWVLEQACSFAVRANLPWVAVNVSPVQFRNTLFAERVASALERTGLSPRRLQLEITEGVFIDSSGLTDRTLSVLRQTGVRIALDDFGTGYSSMSYLRQYAVDKLKIDRSFVTSLGTSADSDAIVRAMVSLARSLRLVVTAEGVETVEQRDHLAAIGCHELQGHLLSRPISDTEFIALMERDSDQVSGCRHNAP